MKISRSSRTHVFINNFPSNERVRMLKSKADLKKLNPESVDVFIKSKFDHYSDRPEEMSKITFAEFVADYNVQKKKHASIDEEPNSEDENISVCSDDMEFESKVKLKTQYVKGKRKIIRFMNYKIDEDPDNFFRSNLLLFCPWRNEYDEIENVDCRANYLLHELEITEIRNSFIKIDLNSNKIDDLVSDIENEDLNYDNQPKDLNNDAFSTDILFDVNEVPAQGEVAKFFIMNKIDEGEYFKLMRELNYKQRKYCVHI